MASSSVIPMRWLRRKVAVDEAERIHSDPDVAGGKPFGAAYDSWLKFKGSLTQADELWLYDSAGKEGEGHCRNYGVAVVRHGAVRAHLLVMIG
jgi:hypothetical protein